MTFKEVRLHALVAAATTTGFFGLAARAWEPSKAAEFVVPAGTGGRADHMARFIRGRVATNELMTQLILVVNKAFGAGAEGFLEGKGDNGKPHTIVFMLSNLFAGSLAAGVRFKVGSEAT